MRKSQKTCVHRIAQHLMLLLWLCAMCLAESTGAQSSGTKRQKQTADDDLRSIVPEKFVEKRRKKPAGRSRKLATYKRVTPAAVASPSETVKPATTAQKQYAQLGLTIWRLRKSTAKDSGAKLVVQDKEGAAEWTPIRVEAGKPLAVDDLVRLSIESSIEGYLYVIDRGQYADGTIGEPKLIFPTSRIRGGDNSVQPGRLIEIPAQTDSRSYFRLTAPQGELVAELLTIIVAKEPLAGLAEQISSRPLVLSNDLVAGWERDWAGKVEHFELAKGEGRPWTKAEQEAGADATRDLTQDDAPPQTIFRVAHSANSPVFVKVELRVRPAAMTP